MDRKKLINRIYDYGLALSIVAAIVMLIIPLYDWILDILLAFDMALSFVIMFTAMFATDVLQMSFFPTILLFTTIFELRLTYLPQDLFLLREVRDRLLLYLDPSLVVVT